MSFRFRLIPFLAMLVLAAIGLWGYSYTALALAQRLDHSVWLALGLILVNELLLRWLLVARRALALERARQPGPYPHHALARTGDSGRSVPGDQPVEEVGNRHPFGVRHPHTAPGSNGAAAG